MGTHNPTHVLIPVKAFGRAKARLASALGESERDELARSMATNVVAAARGYPTWIVCDDNEVATWTHEAGANVSWQPGRGLNGAIAAATTERFADGAARVIVIHSDLPLVTSLDALVPDNEDKIVIAPDRHDAGTNAISVPTPEFHFAFGKGSFVGHLAEVQRLGLPLRIVRQPAFGWDVDEPADLTVFG